MIEIPIAQQIVQGRAGPLIRDVLHVDAGHAL